MKVIFIILLLIIAGGIITMVKIEQKNKPVNEEHTLSKGDVISVGNIKVTLTQISVHRLEINPETGLGGDELQADLKVTYGKESKTLFLISRTGFSSMKTWKEHTFSLDGGDYNKVTLIVSKVELGKEFALTEEDSVLIDNLSIKVNKIVNIMAQDKNETWNISKRHVNLSLIKDNKEETISIYEGKSAQWNDYTIQFLRVDDSGAIIKVDKN